MSISTFFLSAVLAMLFVLALIVRSPGFKGFLGERRVSKALSRQSDERGMLLFDDVTLPSRGGTTQIDHVLISRYGIFVIETKNMAGWIFGAEKQSQWTQVIYRKKTKFQNPLRQNFKHIKAIEECLNVDSSKIVGAVVFVGGAVPKTEFPVDVHWRLRSLETFIGSRQQQILSDEEVEIFSRQLRERRFEQSMKTKRLHVENVKKAQMRHEAGPNMCPRCGAEMVERRSGKTGERFLGCSNFPKCRGTREADNLMRFPSRQQ